MKQFGLGKSHKLCSKIAIDRLFGSRVASDAGSAGSYIGNALVYPLRAVWAANYSRRPVEPVQFLVSVPKKRLRHAVDRVTMRRRIREAYRLNRHDVELAGFSAAVDVAFVYIADGLEPYVRVEKAMQKLLYRIYSSKSLLANESVVAGDGTVD